MAFHKRVVARSAWHRPWLWDFGATLGVVNAFFVPMVIRDQLPADIEGAAVLALLLLTYVAFIGVFTVADRRVGEQLPSLAETGSAFVLIQIPAAVVFIYLGVLLIADVTVWHDPNDLLVTSLVFIGANAAVISGGSLLVAHKSR